MHLITIHIVQSFDSHQRILFTLVMQRVSASIVYEPPAFENTARIFISHKWSLRKWSTNQRVKTVSVLTSLISLLAPDDISRSKSKQKSRGILI